MMERRTSPLAGLRSPTLRETNEKVNAQSIDARRSLKSSAVPRREAASFNKKRNVDNPE